MADYRNTILLNLYNEQHNEWSLTEVPVTWSGINQTSYYTPKYKMLNFNLSILKNSAYSNEGEFYYEGNINNGFRNWKIQNLESVAPVGRVGYDNLFMNCYSMDNAFRDTYIHEGYIPETVAYIGNAFRGDTLLNHINAPNCIVTQATNAFRGCTQMNEGFFPDTLEFAENMYCGAYLFGNYNIGNNIKSANNMLRGRIHKEVWDDENQCYVDDYDLHLWVNENTDTFNTFYNGGTDPLYSQGDEWEDWVEPYGYYFLNNQNTYMHLAELKPDTIWIGGNFEEAAPSGLNANQFSVLHNFDVTDTEGLYGYINNEGIHAVAINVDSARNHIEVNNWVMYQADMFKYCDNIKFAGSKITNATDVYLGTPVDTENNVFQYVRNANEMFANCPGLTEIFMPNNVEYALGMYNDCPNIEGEYDWNNVNNIRFFPEGTDKNELVEKGMFANHDNDNHQIIIHVSKGSVTDQTLKDCYYQWSEYYPGGYNKNNIIIINGTFPEKDSVFLMNWDWEAWNNQERNVILYENYYFHSDRNMNADIPKPPMPNLSKIHLVDEDMINLNTVPFGDPSEWHRCNFRYYRDKAWPVYKESDSARWEWTDETNRRGKVIKSPSAKDGWFIWNEGVDNIQFYVGLAGTELNNVFYVGDNRNIGQWDWENGRNILGDQNTECIPNIESTMLHRDFYKFAHDLEFSDNSVPTFHDRPKYSFKKGIVDVMAAPYEKDYYYASASWDKYLWTNSRVMPPFSNWYVDRHPEWVWYVVAPWYWGDSSLPNMWWLNQSNVNHYDGCQWITSGPVYPKYHMGCLEEIPEIPGDTLYWNNMYSGCHNAKLYTTWGGGPYIVCNASRCVRNISWAEPQYDWYNDNYYDYWHVGHIKFSKLNWSGMFSECYSLSRNSIEFSPGNFRGDEIWLDDEAYMFDMRVFNAFYNLYVNNTPIKDDMPSDRDIVFLGNNNWYWYGYGRDEFGGSAWNASNEFLKITSYPGYTSFMEKTDWNGDPIDNFYNMNFNSQMRGVEGISDLFSLFFSSSGRDYMYDPHGKGKNTYAARQRWIHVVNHDPYHPGDEPYDRDYWELEAPNSGNWLTFACSNRNSPIARILYETEYNMIPEEWEFEGGVWDDDNYCWTDNFNKHSPRYFKNIPNGFAFPAYRISVRWGYQNIT